MRISILFWNSVWPVEKTVDTKAAQKWKQCDDFVGIRRTEAKKEYIWNTSAMMMLYK